MESGKKVPKEADLEKIAEALEVSKEEVRGRNG